jgi:hypothetical protein
MPTSEAGMMFNLLRGAMVMFQEPRMSSSSGGVHGASVACHL